MKLLTSTIAFLALIWSIDCAQLFEIDETGDEDFTIRIGSVVVFRHTAETPMLFVGSGETVITTTSGNHKIKDTVNEKVALKATSKECNTAEEKCVIKFSHKRTNDAIQLVLRSKSHAALGLAIQGQIKGFDRLWLRVAAEPNEEIYGGGEQFSYANLRRRGAFEMYVNEQGIGRDKRSDFTEIMDELGLGGDYDTTNFPQPTFVSSRRFSFHYDGYHLAYLDFSNERFHEVNILNWKKSLPIGEIYINAEDTLSELVQELSVLLGRQPNLPGWIQEAIMLGVQGGDAIGKFNLAKSHRIPVGSVWIQDLSKQSVTDTGARFSHDWEPDFEKYPDLTANIRDLAAKGVPVLGYINPNFVKDSPLFKKASGKGYLIKNSEGKDYIQSVYDYDYDRKKDTDLSFGTVDLTNSDAYGWLKKIIKTKMIDAGLGGWMADAGQYLPHDAVLSDGRPGVDVHNEWPVLWAKLNREAIDEKNKQGEIVFFTKSGYSGTSKYTTLVWNSEQNTCFDPAADSILSTIYANLNLAFSGITLSHFDVGGYTPGVTRSEEYLLRSAEYAIFTPVFRTNTGTLNSGNAQWDSPGVIEKFAKCAKRFAQLANYRKKVVQEAADGGLPAMRPVQLHYTFGSDMFSGKPLPDMYLFGSDILVAPVYEKGATQRRVTLPLIDGAVGSVFWINIWTGKKIYPDQDLGSVEAPLGQPPVYYRSDSKFATDFEKLRM